MADLRGFNASEHEEMRDFEPLPNGRYLAAVVKSELKPTSNGAGAYLELDFQVLDGQYKGRHVFARLNLQNKSVEAVRIAQIELASICKAVNVLTPKDSSELHDLPLAISVAVEKRQDNGELANRIKGYYPKSELQKPAAGAAQAAGQGKAAPGKAPWAR